MDKNTLVFRDRVYYNILITIMQYSVSKQFLSVQSDDTINEFIALQKASSSNLFLYTYWLPEDCDFLFCSLQNVI